MLEPRSMRRHSGRFGRAYIPFEYDRTQCHRMARCDVNLGSAGGKASPMTSSGRNISLYFIIFQRRSNPLDMTGVNDSHEHVSSETLRGGVSRGYPPNGGASPLATFLAKRSDSAIKWLVKRLVSEIISKSKGRKSS